MPKYSLVTAGGTFDRFHKGHRKLLNHAFATSKQVVIGITSDDFASLKRSQIQPHATRKKVIQAYLTKHKLTRRGEIVKISNIFGPLNEKTLIQAMVVTQDTKPNAIKINNWRKQNNLPTLQIEQAPLALAQDKNPISSARIRAGEINRAGVVWSKHVLWGKLPRSLRQELRQPLGPIIKNIEKRVLDVGGVGVSVGDVSTIELIQAGIKPDIAVVDLFVQRKRKYSNLSELNINSDFKVVTVRNPAGALTKQSVQLISKLFNQLSTRSSNYLIHVVDGEEDLLTLPIILFAPLGSVVYYGQPPIGKNPSGMVIVNVTEKLKSKIFKLLQQFTPE